MPLNPAVSRGIESLERLNTARDLLERFAEERKATGLSPEQRDLLNEARFRMDQVAWFLEQVIEHMGNIAAKGELDSNLMFALQTLTESLYYFAHRASKALRRQPEFKNLDIKGIRTVRNKLLDHPDSKDSGVLEVTFVYTSWTGPVVKGLRATGSVEDHLDPGLWANVDEFSDALSAILKPLVK